MRSKSGLLMIAAGAILLRSPAAPLSPRLRAPGLTIPESFLLRADEVIE